MAVSTDAVVRYVTEDDVPAAEALLCAAGLPLAGVRDHWQRFHVIDDEHGLAALIGSERYRRVWLLRSLYVRPDRRGAGLGTALMRHVISGAQRAHATGLYLLTEDAAAYFERHGFIAIPRADAPQELAGSAELQGACSESAVLMRHQPPA